MKKIVSLFTAVLAIIAVSCDHNEYVIELVPRGQDMQRTLTFGRIAESSDKSEKPSSQPAATSEPDEPAYVDVDANEVAAISKLYPASAPVGETRRVKFTGTFKGAMPNDVGGKGRYVCFDTLLGSTCAYVESFRGSDNLLGQIEVRFKQADRLVDLALGWAKQEFGSRTGFDKLQKFLDQDVRKDVKNLALYVWLFASARQNVYMSPAIEENAQKDILARAIQFLVDNQYIAAEDIPALYRLNEEPTGDTNNELTIIAPILGKILAKKAGLEGTDVYKAVLAAFAPEKKEDLLKSVNAYLERTEEYRQVLAKWEKDKAASTNKDSEKPEPSAALGELLDPLANSQFSIGDSRDAVIVTLATGVEPIATNGAWDSNSGKVSWNHRVLGRNEQNFAPVNCYAVWCKPDAMFQKLRFGKTMLEGKELVAYCIWRQSLTQSEGDRWDRMLMECKAGDDVVGKLTRFSVAATQPAGNVPRMSSYAVKETETLIKAILAPTTQPAEKK